MLFLDVSSYSSHVVPGRVRSAALCAAVRCACPTTAYAVTEGNCPAEACATLDVPVLQQSAPTLDVSVQKQSLLFLAGAVQ